MHTDIELAERRKEIFAIVGGSGSGKSTLLRELLLLQVSDSGFIRVLGVDFGSIDAAV